MLTILIIEDNHDDIFLFRTALMLEGITNSVQSVRDSKEAIRYISGEGKYSDRDAFPFPGVIFIDLNMPKIDGEEVFAWLKAHPECSLRATIVFASTAKILAVKEAHFLGANAYVVKPRTFSGLQKLIRKAHDLWDHREAPGTTSQM